MSIFKKKKLNILVTGAKGQLGSYLVNRLRVRSFKKNSMFGYVFGIDKDELDITNADEVSYFFNKNNVDPSVEIDYVIHCAAATDTAAIEKDPYGFSYNVNVLGAKNIAHSCAYNRIKLIFISTDYVLSEYSEACGCKMVEHPVNAYGMQKLLAEREVEIAFKDRPHDYMILRSSWMFGNSHRSFIEKLFAGIAKSLAKVDVESNGQAEGTYEHKVVDDAYGRPTHVEGIFSKIVDAIYENHVNGMSIGTIDCCPHVEQISRNTWASIILEDFKQILNERLSKANQLEFLKLANRIASSVSIVSCNQADFGGMKHPGKVDNGKYFADFAHEDIVHKDAVECRTVEHHTMMYILSNFDYIVKLINDEYQKAKNMLLNMRSNLVV